MSEPTQPSNLPALDTTGVNSVQPDTTHQNVGWATNESPSSSNFNWLFNNIWSWLVYSKALLAYWLGANANEALTITGNAVVPTQANSTFQVAGGTINNATPTNFKTGRIWMVTGNGSNPTTLAHAAGGAGQFNIQGAVNAILTNTNDAIIFQLDGGSPATWQELWRSAGLGHRNLNVQLITSTTTLTVPVGVYGLEWEAIGGGGGGGGGGSAAYSGTNGNAGGNGGDGGATIIGSAATEARGGKGGGASAGGIYNSATGAVGAAPAAISPTVSAVMAQSGALIGVAGSAAVTAASGSGSQYPYFQNIFRILGALGGAGVGTGGGLIAPNPGAAGTDNMGQGGGGAAGGQGGNSTCAAGGAGGQNGEFARGYLAVTPGQSLVVTIGAGGTAGTAGPIVGGANALTIGGVGGVGGKGLAIIKWVQ